jgi:tRNA pseudouridine38-40 synthase
MVCVRIALGVEYDGLTFSGWQSQTHGNTLQDVLEAALRAIAGIPIRTSCAGRTDAGVHAVGQVVHFDSTVDRPISAWVRGVNAHLPGTVAVRWAQVVSDEFHARYSAVARSYRYLLLNRPVRPALMRGRVGWQHTILNTDAMTAATAHLLGEHDFSAFRASGCQAKSPIRNLQSAAIAVQADLIVMDFTANAFLHHMVRNMVGALVDVGMGRHDPDWLVDLLNMRDRSQAPATYDAAGLYFVGVDYGPRWQLPRDSRMMTPFTTPHL